MRKLQVALPLLVGAGFLLCTTASYATQEYAKKEKKGCNTCHSKVAPTDKELMKKSLTDAGKYYQSHNHSLEGYKEEKK
jgi:hypothetical protein